MQNSALFVDIELVGGSETLMLDFRNEFSKRKRKSEEPTETTPQFLVLRVKLAFVRCLLYHGCSLGNQNESTRPAYI